jgi:hypothetical protein
MADEATMHNQAAYDQIAGLYAARHAERDRSAGMLAHAARVLPGRVVRADLRRLPVAGQSMDGAGQGVRLEQVPYAQDARGWFFYRDPAELEEQVRGAGLQVVAVTEEITHRHWLKILARAA